MTDLANSVLPLIRTRADLHRWGSANQHGLLMHEAVDILEAAVTDHDPQDVFAVTSKALASSLTVIARADDSSGIIGNACRRLLELHPVVAARASAPVASLVKWMIKFQFDNEVDYFELDPVAYAPALGQIGLKKYRLELDRIARELGPAPREEQRWSSPNSHLHFVLEWNARRLAVLDKNVGEIIRTHLRDAKVAAWYQDTAEALAEVGEYSLAIEWARRGAEFDGGHQSARAGDYWCELLAQHRPDELLDARLTVFRRWPTAVHAMALHDAAGDDWNQYYDDVLAELSTRPVEAVNFAHSSLGDIRLAWSLAHSLSLKDDRLWASVAKSYEKIDPLAVLPVLSRLVEADLTETGAGQYISAARRLKKMRRLALGSPEAAQVDDYIRGLRDTHRRRPRLQSEFDRAGLP